MDGGRDPAPRVERQPARWSAPVVPVTATLASGRTSAAATHAGAARAARGLTYHKAES